MPTPTAGLAQVIAIIREALESNPSVAVALQAQGIDPNAMQGLLNAVADFYEQYADQITAGDLQGAFAQLQQINPQLAEQALPFLPVVAAYAGLVATVLGAHAQAWAEAGFNPAVYDLLTGLNEGPQSLTGSDAQEFLGGLTGDDTLNGEAGDDIISANAGIDIAFGGAGNDTVFGNAGDDKVYGNVGLDVLFGGQGNDMAAGGQGDDQVYGNLGDDNIYGNFGLDIMYGGQGADLLLGGQGDDQLIGGGGSDTLNGNKDNDVMTGGGDADLFVFGSGDDVVLDFEVGVDRLSNGSGATVDALVSSAVTIDGGVMLSFDGGSITLMGVTTAEVSAALFV